MSGVCYFVCYFVIHFIILFYSMEREDITRSTLHFIASPSKQVFQTGKVSGRNFDVGGNRLGKGRMGIIN